MLRAEDRPSHKPNLNFQPHWQSGTSVGLFLLTLLSLTFLIQKSPPRPSSSSSHFTSFTAPSSTRLLFLCLPHHLFFPASLHSHLQLHLRRLCSSTQEFANIPCRVTFWTSLRFSPPRSPRLPFCTRPLSSLTGTRIMSSSDDDMPLAGSRRPNGKTKGMTETFPPVSVPEKA